MPTHLMSFIPDIALVLLALGVLIADLAGEGKTYAFHLAWMGLGLVSVLALRGMGAGTADAAGIAGYLADADRSAWKALFALAGFGSVLLAGPYLTAGGNARGPLGRTGAFLGLLIFCVLGMFALVSASDLLAFYLGLELATLPIFALAAFQPGDGASAEAGAKYALMGGFSSALTLFGISFLYGASGSLGFEALAYAARTAPASPLLWGGIVFLMGGLGFKLAMAPLHMWAPDVYQGAPTPVAAFLSVGSKAAAVAAAAVILLGPLEPVRQGLAGFLMAGAVLSMLIGNLGAMRQTDLRRFVGYSSIAQAGYMLVAFVGDPAAARLGLRYNLLAYGATSFALFYVVAVVGREGPESMAALRGLSRRNPPLAALLALAMFSLAGVPPLAGFLGKFLLFSAAAQDGHYVLVGLALANAVLSFYYCMRPVKEAYWGEPGTAPMAERAKPGLRGTLAIWGLAAALLILGLCPAALAWFART
jgi:NADH-quinone oxidoreductase subunit N